MNVTNRRKSTDADTPQATQPTAQQQQQQQLLAYASCRQAATATGPTAGTRQEHLQPLQHRVHEVLEDNNDDQEQVVTSTSSDCLLPLSAEGEGEEVTLDLESLVTSPARITSSTNNYDILTYNSDSLSHEEIVMPSTSGNSRLVREGTTKAGSLNSITLHHSISSRSLKSHNDMVARDTTPTTVAEAGDGGGSAVDSGASTSNISSDMTNQNHKIILKLPKPSLAAPTESHSLSSRAEDDLRKVEPLKINLHNTHHTSHHTPKITIKPVVKDPSADILMSSEECSSSAEDEMVSKLNASEPHIVPKLTIRAENEELSTVVPKLTIKINDSTNASSEGHCTHPAANTPPIPKLTIKTGQDGHSESIITNISPASSTTSSSSSSCSSSSTSTNSRVATNSSMASANAAIPKLTIKPLQKFHDKADSEHPSIPKLCIKSNIICAEMAPTEDPSTTKIPKLTIKTSQEHAVIITQHNDHAGIAGGIPKLTIKTKSMDSAEDSANSSATSIAQNSPNEKIPKITIKTNNIDTPNIVALKRSTMKSQLEGSHPLSPKQAVPKLTITRQQNDMVVTNKHAINAEEDCSGSIPKMTIKTQSKCETVPKLTIKNRSCQQIPSSTEESGMDSDNEDDEDVAQHCKTVPKLTIKNLGSPQQKLTIVQEIPADVNKACSVSNTATSAAATSAAASDKININATVSSADIDDFVDLLTVDNGGGESSNSQEFCGFNDNTADSAAKIVVLTSSDLIVPDNNAEVRRNSDDMDIDEDLQTVHEPKIFQNDIHFKNQTTNMHELLNGTITHSKMTQIIDMVDLTSSPSRSNSPAQFDYNDDSNSAIGNVNSLPTNLSIPSTNILMERLQRDNNTVIQNTQQLKPQQQQEMESNSPIPPPLKPKPNAIQTSLPASLKYPQLAERLMSNGNTPSTVSNDNDGAHNLPQKNIHLEEENIIDSIEILDTPEGSPRNSLDERPENLSSLNDKSTPSLPNGLHYPKDTEIYSLNNNNSNLKRNALSANLAGQISQANHLDEGELEAPSSKQRRLDNEDINTKNSLLIVNHSRDLINQNLQNSLEELNQLPVVAAALVTTQPKDFNCLKQITSHQRARKQKHEHLLPVAMEEVLDSMQINSNDSIEIPSVEKKNNEQANENVTPVQKKRGRPRKLITAHSTLNNDANTATPQLTSHSQRDEAQQVDLSSKSRRVQMLRKRLAIDMVDADEPLRVLDELESSVVTGAGEENKGDMPEIDSQKRERNLRTPLRTSRRSNTPTLIQMECKAKARAPSTLAVENNNKRSLLKQNNENALNNFIESNSSMSSSAASNSSATLTSTLDAGPISDTTTTIHALSMATQIDLTMSSSSSNSNGSTINTITTAEATFSKQTTLMQSNAMPALTICSGNSTTSCVGIGGGGSSNNSMLPPTTILSSSDPLPDVIFKHNDFSSILATQQLRVPIMSVADSGLNESQDEDMADEISGPDNSGDDSASSSSLSTPGRGRGRGRGSRGGRGRAYKAHRLGRNASAVSKAIAMNRPRCVGALKHTPDPDRIKGLYSPSPSVFEEDTRMSADLSQSLIIQTEPIIQTPTKQPDFLNNEESQSSLMSNASMLDPNNVAALQNGSSVKKPVKRKKMEVCVAEDADITVSSIAEYDWPPPKGCCPSKNRDTFMIQEQVALYLGIKSFKRKYPDLPRRQIDMEERNYLQEKNLVSEKMCDLGITAVWASDILDIMYSDFYDKYEEYKDFVRQKHLREIEAKQKSLGLNVAGRGLQARDRAMLSTSKWNAYFNRMRKQERLSCLDLQTLTVNKPCPASAPIAAIPNRPVAEAIAQAIRVENIPQPPTLLKERVWEPIRPRDVYYPLSLVPGQFCEKYCDYASHDFRQFPLNTVLDAPSHIMPPREESTDTDSATEEFSGGDRASSLTTAERLNRQRRIRRIRAKHARKLNNDQFKVPPLPGAISNSCTESSSSSSSDDDSSSETDSDTSSCSSLQSDDASEDENSPATCGVCQHPQNRNLKDLPELFVQCYTCRRKVHPSCIEMPHRMANRVRNYNWQCADCKCCIKCKRKPNQNKMLYCEQCDRGFHIYCLTIKAVPDGRWSCDRCSICMRCGATKPEGLPFMQPSGEKLKTKNRKLKWINEYRIDHITKLREHCSMLCVPCGRAKNVKRVQINTHYNTTNTYVTSPGTMSPVQSPTSSVTTSPPQISPVNTNSSAGSTTTTSMTNSNLLNAATITSASNTNQTITTILTTTGTSSLTTTTTTANSLEIKDSISLTPNSLTLTNTTFTPQNTVNTTAQTSNSITTANASLSVASTGAAPAAIATAAATMTTATATTTATASVGAPPVVA